jgi:hypothetical protein
MSDRRRKIVIEVIDDCGMCYHLNSDDEKDYCNHPYFKVPGNDIKDQEIGCGPLIPEWCPLKDD